MPMEPSIQGKNLVFLVVDDYPTMREIIRSGLKSLGYSYVKEARDGIEALELMKTSPVQFIIADWQMPRMDGLELLRTIRKTEVLRDIPFMMVTAQAERSQVVEAIREGASNYLMKPFTIDDLGAKIQSVLARSGL